MTLDLESRAFLDQVRSSGGPPIHEMAVEDVRAMGAAFARLAGDPLSMHRVDDVDIAVPGDVITARVLWPSPAPSTVIVWCHGGGWVFGTIDEAEGVARRLATACDATVVVVGYRLAPEHRYPTAADDAMAAFEWAQANVAELARPGAPVVVGGDSCGGNLAAVVAQRAHDAGIRPAAQLLVQPALDCDFDRPSYLADDNQLVLDRAAMQWFWDQYVPDEARRTEPGAAPLRRIDLEGLAPAVVVTSEHDPLRDEGEDYAASLRAAGVPVEYHCFRGQMHGFFLFPVALPAADEALAFVSSALPRAIEARDERAQGATS